MSQLLPTVNQVINNEIIDKDEIMNEMADYVDPAELSHALAPYAKTAEIVNNYPTLTYLENQLLSYTTNESLTQQLTEYASYKYVEPIKLTNDSNTARIIALENSYVSKEKLNEALQGTDTSENISNLQEQLNNHTHTEIEDLSVPGTLTARTLNMSGAINTDTINMSGTIYVSSKPSDGSASNAYWSIYGRYFGSVDTNRLYFNCTRYSGTNRIIYINEPSQDITILNQTITHNAPVNEDIANFQIGSPVFTTGYVVHLQDDKYISGTENPIDCITSVKSSGSYRQYLGICVALHKSGDVITIGDTIKKDIELKQDTIDFATHGDFYFRVNDTSEYSVGDIVLFDGNKLSDDLVITTKIMSSIVGKVTGIIDDHLLCVFKD